MSDTTGGGAFYARPTIGQRLRWALGYRKRFPEEFEASKAASHPHWAKTIVGVRFDWVDRIRLLLTGAVEVEIVHGTDKPVEIISAAAVSLIGPGDFRLKRSR